jgi:YfiR/HmsC-like
MPDLSALRGRSWWMPFRAIMLGLIAPACLLMASPLIQPSLGGQGELTLKAQFTIELASFLGFPKLKDPSWPFVIAVVGESPFQDELEAYAKGRRIQGRLIRIRYYPRVPEGQDCDLLFICRSEWPRAKAIVAWCHSKGILTVAEGDQLAAQGVMVNLLVEDAHLKLGLNQRVLQEEGFIIGAQVLRVARVLVPSR